MKIPKWHILCNPWQGHRNRTKNTTLVLPWPWSPHDSDPTGQWDIFTEPKTIQNPRKNLISVTGGKLPKNMRAAFTSANFVSFLFILDLSVFKNPT